MHPWLTLLLAALCEVGWPLGFKLADIFPKYHWLCIFLAVISMALSGFFLFLAQKHISIGTAYAVWTGIGAACTFSLGVVFFGDALNWGRALGVALIVSGVALFEANAVLAPFASLPLMAYNSH